VENAGEASASAGDDDSIDALAPREGILARVRRDAEADAIRHAEDMLDRDFPIVDEAVTIAEARLAALRVAYDERRTRLAVRIDGLSAGILTAEAQLHATDAALLAEGIPQSHLALPPQRGPRSPLVRTAAVAGAVVALYLLLDLIDVEPGTVLPIVLGAAVLAGLLAFFLPGPPLEPNSVMSLREARQDEEEEIAALRADLKRAEKGLHGLEEKTLSQAETEAQFAAELVTAYQSAAFSSLPAGTLEGGRTLKRQTVPKVQLPSWTQGLEAAR
jgi:hypothetical protein